MKSKKNKIIALVIAIVLTIGFVVVATNYNTFRYLTVERHFTETITYRFNLLREGDDWYSPSMSEFDEMFAMINEDGVCIIGIYEDTRIRFDSSGRFRKARNITLEDGQTLGELLDGRKLTVTWDMATASVPSYRKAYRILVLDN